MIAASHDPLAMLSTRRPPRAESGFTWSSGRSHTTSSSPDCNAASLALISGTIRSSTPASLGSPGSKYFANRVSTRRSPGVYDTNLNGPVPIGCVASWPTLARGTILTCRSDRMSANPPYGALSVNTTVPSSGASTAATMS